MYKNPKQLKHPLMFVLKAILFFLWLKELCMRNHIPMVAIQIQLKKKKKIIIILYIYLRTKQRQTITSLWNSP